MPLLLIPLLLVAVLVLAVLLYPLGLVQRYRAGVARRRARPWLAGLNAWLLAVSALLFVASAWVGEHWVAHALLYACCGLLLGVLIGIAGIWTTRFEHHPEGAWYTPNRWLVFALTMLLAARIALGIWQTLWPPSGVQPPWLRMLADHATLIGMAGVLLGYYLGYAWALRARLSRR
ncbi:DUF1453 domain-containing protein [Luteimonas notoginsengisoli]|uniref:DUF1453 domain-containing protein n=1 Tax=Luteimonas notoginsengisoli TaxID=1578200 RepID=A0ABV7UT15_9GAMM